MSGPKCASYTVERNLQVERIALERAWTEAGEAEATLVVAEQCAKDTAKRLGLSGLAVMVTPTRPPGGAPREQVESYLAALRLRARCLNDEVQRAAAASEIAAAIAELAATASLATADCDGRAAGLGERAPDLAIREQTVARIVGRLSNGVSETEARDLKNLATKVVGQLDRVQFEQLAFELRFRVQQTNEVALRREQDAEQASRLLSQLRGLEGEDIDVVVTELREVEGRRSALTNQIFERAVIAEQTARARSDRDYAARVISEEFALLGYEVEEGFSVMTPTRDETRFRTARLREYSVSVTPSPDAAQLNVHLVRNGVAAEQEEVTAERRRRDREMEEVWCTDFAQLLARLKKHCIACRVVERVRPGTEPVALAPARQPATSGRLRRAPVAISRQI